MSEKLPDDPHRDGPVRHYGRPLNQAQGAMILIHGRGDSAAGILGLAQALPHPELCYLAPQAAGGTWYPHSFLAPLEQNQPGIDAGLRKISAVLSQVEAAGILAERVILAGFSQGACLTAEYTARHPRRYGGVLIFSGGVIGPPGLARRDRGDLAGTPVFLGCSDVDAHIPVSRVHETAGIFRRMGAEVLERIYPGMPHTIIQDELDEAGRIVERLLDG